jgi:thiamine biosynthesis protein ThiI
MKYFYILRFGEIFIKGKNKAYFETTLKKNIKHTLFKAGIYPTYNFLRGRIFVIEETDNPAKTAEILSRIPGIVSVSVGLKSEKNFEAMAFAALKLIKEFNSQPSSFKVESKRADKSFPYTSPEISKEVASVLLKNNINIPVDVKNPQMKIGVEIQRDGAYIFCQTLKGAGGLPVGVSERAVVMLSGGIDSPVAAYLMQKRGTVVVPVYFHGFPFTSDKVKDKIYKLAEKLSFYQKKLHLNIVNFTPVLMELKKKCPEKLIIIMMRRFMVRVAEKIAENEHCLAVVTGDNLGQVASQTMENMRCITDASSNMILRPLLGFDKVDIVNIAKKIDTYETSIEPFEDCCSLFVPKQPEIHGKLEEVREAEKLFDVDKLLNEVMKSIEVIKFGDKNE